jgi:hypothetical protein
MNVSPEYEGLTIILSAGGFVLSILYLTRVIGSYRRWHDERAAINLSKGIGLMVIAFGLLISSAGFVFQEHGDWSVAGLMLSRGALIALLATLLLVAVRPGTQED